MQYALLIYNTPEGTAAAAANTGPSEWVAYTQALKNANALVTLARLQDEETATSVRLRDDERLLTDGPFIETKDHLLGFYLIEAPDLDAALDWATRMPLARFGTIEVRPVLTTPVLQQIVQE